MGRGGSCGSTQPLSLVTAVKVIEKNEKYTPNLNYIYVQESS